MDKGKGRQAPAGVAIIRQVPAPKGLRRIVVKIGSSVIAGDSGLSSAAIGRLAKDVSGARARGLEVIVVSSGAVAAGREILRLPGRPATTQLKQAAAAVGQSRLMRAWETALSRQKLKAAQILLTWEDLRDRGRYLSARNTLLTLLRLGVVPVINENDTVAVEEIRFGDNDVLSALVAGLSDAGLLVLLTDQEGLYDRDPRRSEGATLRSVVRPEEAPSTGSGGRPGPLGSGGMDSKVKAASLAAGMGIPAVIASGLTPGTLSEILENGSRGSWFEPDRKPIEKRKQWIAFASRPAGRISVDRGAMEALVRRMKSLLPSGVKDLSGEFDAGDAVSLEHDGTEFARGLVNYSSVDLARIKGLKSSQIEAALSYKPADEVIHRDNLVVLKP